MLAVVLVLVALAIICVTLVISGGHARYEALEITVARGRFLRPLPEGERYLGFLFASGANPEDVEAALRSAHAELEIVIKPE